MFWKTAMGRADIIRGKDPFGFGVALGRARRRTIREISALVVARPGYEKIYGSSRLAERIFFLQNFYPSLGEEIRGLGCGAGTDPELLAALNFFEDDIWEGAEHCSLIFKKEARQVLIGWNEDGASVYLNRLSVVRAQTSEGEFISLNYPGLLCGDTLAVTSFGLVLALQSLNFAKDPLSRLGLPRGLAGRLFLDCRSLGEVLALAQHLTDRERLAHGFHLFAYDWKKDDALAIEVHPHYRCPWWVQLRAPDFYVHTNHYLLADKEAKTISAPVTPNSRARLAYLKMFRGAHLTPEILADILADRPPRPIFSRGEKICREGPTATLRSQVLKISKGAPSVLWTSPGPPRPSRLADWAKEKLNF